MLISTIVKNINEALAGELLTYPELRQFMDSTIDDINQALDTTFPVFSELSGLKEVIEALISGGDEFLAKINTHEIVNATNSYYISGNETAFRNAFIGLMTKLRARNMWGAEHRPHHHTHEFGGPPRPPFMYVPAPTEEEIELWRDEANAIWEHERIPVMEYDYFPDRYLREVVVKGAAYKFYIMDEEGLQTAQQFKYDYQDAMFRMTRDYINEVPFEYRAYNKASVPSHYDDYMTDKNYWRHGGLW